MLTGLVQAQEVTKLDSTILYNFTSATDSVPVEKSHYDAYNNAGMPTHLSRFAWNNAMWLFAGERICTYDDNGNRIAMEELNTNHIGDKKVEYTWNTDKTLAREIYYKNINEGIPSDVEWEKSLMKEYNYNTNGNPSSVDISVYTSYWQGVRKIVYDYSGGDQPVSRSLYNWIPKVMVKSYKGLYTQNPSGSTNYANIAWKIEPGTTLDQLEDYLINDSTEILNVYVNDGSQDIRYNLHGVAGKTLKAVLNGDNDEQITIDPAQLRDDYKEWFYMYKGNDLTLINCNLKESMLFDLRQVVIMHDDLYSTTQKDQYKNTAYLVKGAASPDDLDKVVLPDNIDWVNVYLKEDPDDPEAPYGRVDIPGGGGKTLNEVLTENGISISQLKMDYKEWFYDKEGQRKLVRTNVKAVQDITSYTDNIVIREMLISTGETDGYISNTYNILPDATADDLAAVTLPDTVTWINVYINDGSSDQRISLYDVEGKTLKAALLDGDNRDNVVIDLNQLRHDYGEWFYTSKGKIVLARLNVKAMLNLGNTAPVEVTEDLLSTGGDEYLNTAYLLRPHATLEDLKGYTLDNVDFLSVYINNGDENQRINLHGVNGKTLDQVLTGDNDEKETIDLSQLRGDYWEWFNDSEDQPVLVNLNVKAVKILHEAPTVDETDGLISETEGNIFLNVAFRVKTSAEEADLAQYKVPDDMDSVLVFARPVLQDTAYLLTGVAGKDLQAILNGDNNESVTVDLKDLKEHYAEWFVNEDGDARRIKLNIKAFRQINTGLDELKSKTEYNYSVNKRTATTILYDEEGQPTGNQTRVISLYDETSGKTVSEETLTSADGNTWTPVKMVEWTYDKDDRLMLMEVMEYDSEASAYATTSKTYYYYPESPSGVSRVVSLETHMYPNPVADVLYLTVTGKESFHYSIYNMQGSLVTDGMATQNHTGINVSGLPAGVYLLKVESGKDHFSGRFIKQ